MNKIYFIHFISFFNKYIEGIINIFIDLILFIFNITIKNENKNKFQILNQNENKQIKQYVDIHNWSNIKLNNDLKYLLYKPMRWRPTIVNKNLFKMDINNLKAEIINKFKKIIKNEKVTVFIKTLFINSFNKFKKNITIKFNEYIKQIKNKKIKNLNINKKQIQIINKFKNKYDHLFITDTDKNRGNVIMFKEYWDNFNKKYLSKNNNN